MRLSLTFLILSLFAFDLSAQVDIPASFYGDMEWRNIGPYRGGRSLGCAGSPGRPLEYYFGATGGGLWKTVDGGNDWFPVTDGQVTLFFRWGSCRSGDQSGYRLYRYGRSAATG